MCSLHAYWKYHFKRYSYESIWFDVKFANFQHSDFYLYNYQLYTNDKYVNESQLKEKCEVNTKEQPCKYTPYVKFQLIKEMKNPWLTVKGVHVNSNDSFVEQTFNLCTFDKIPVMNIFIAIFYELFRKNINFEMKCPFKQVSDCIQFLRIYSLCAIDRENILSKIGRMTTVSYQTSFYPTTPIDLAWFVNKRLGKNMRSFTDIALTSRAFGLIEFFDNHNNLQV